MKTRQALRILKQSSESVHNLVNYSDNIKKIWSGEDLSGLENLLENRTSAIEELNVFETVISDYIAGLKVRKNIPIPNDARIEIVAVLEEIVLLSRIVAEMDNQIMDGLGFF